MTTHTKALTVEDFCQAYNISKSFLYKLIREGKGPRTMLIGRKRLITTEAADKWQADMENETQGVK